MNTLTEENINFIYQDVQVKGLTLEGLQDEMVDHICCSIEPDIDNGISFEIAYNKLMDTIESSIFKNVQHQTLLSTNLKFQNMKKLMIVLGSLSALFLSAGSILKLFHIPPASILLLLGTAIAILGFFPLFFYTSYKEQVEKKNVLLSVTGYFTISFLIIGVLFRVQHWPGAAIALLIGQFLLILLFLPLYLVNAYKKASETKINFLYVLLIFFIGFGVIFMVSATRISRDIVEKFDTINNNATNISKIFTQQNDSLLKKLQEKESYTEIKPDIDKLQALALELDKQIETIKTELKNITKSNSVEEIKHKEHDKAFRKAMLKDNNAYKLKEDFAKYKVMVLELADSEYRKETLSALLDFEMFTGLTYEHGFKSTSLIAGLAMLSGMQKNIKIAEYEILNSLD